MIFKHIEDIEEWLEPVDYQGFWYAVQPYELTLQPRAHCDQQIKDGEADLAVVLEVLKHMARMELTKRLELRRRPTKAGLHAVH